MPTPPDGVDKHEWMLKRLNQRMSSLGCAPREEARCIGYLENADSELHRIVGFYGDREREERILGVSHWIVDIDDEDGLNAFRYVVVENAPHAWPVTAGQLGWDFMKMYRRDTRTGRIVVDEYDSHNEVQETEMTAIDTTPANDGGSR